jgi:hypothetical protein
MPAACLPRACWQLMAAAAGAVLAMYSIMEQTASNVDICKQHLLARNVSSERRR